MYVICVLCREHGIKIIKYKFIRIIISFRLFSPFASNFNCICQVFRFYTRFHVHRWYNGKLPPIQFLFAKHSDGLCIWSQLSSSSALCHLLKIFWKQKFQRMWKTLCNMHYVHCTYRKHTHFRNSPQQYVAHSIENICEKILLEKATLESLF